MANIILVGNHWCDDRGNRWSTDKFTEQNAKGLSNSLINCKNCTDCIMCTNCISCHRCVRCSSCINCTDCLECHSCVQCTCCGSCFYCVTLNKVNDRIHTNN